MSRVARRSSKARAIAAPPDHVHLRTDTASLELAGQCRERSDDLVPVHRSDAVQRALWDEDSAAPEGRRSLGDRHRPEAGYLADEPEAVQKPPRLDRPPGPAQAVNRREVLGQRPEIGIVTRVPSRLWPLRDCLRTGAIIASEGELIEELPHGVAEILATADAPRHPCEGLG